MFPGDRPASDRKKENAVRPKREDPHETPSHSHCKCKEGTDLRFGRSHRWAGISPCHRRRQKYPTFLDRDPMPTARRPGQWPDLGSVYPRAPPARPANHHGAPDGHPRPGRPTAAAAGGRRRRASRAAGTAAEAKVEVGVEADTYNIISKSHNVTSRRIFVGHEYFLGVLCLETRQWWRTFRNRRTRPRTNGKMFLSLIIAINMLIWHWSQNVTIQMTFARNWRNMFKWHTKWAPCLPIGQFLMPHRTQNRIFCVESSSSEETPNTPLVSIK